MVNPDIAFPVAVRAIQSDRGSLATYAKIEARGRCRTAIGENLAGFQTVPPPRISHPPIRLAGPPHYLLAQSSQTDGRLSTDRTRTSGVSELQRRRPQAAVPGSASCGINSP